MRDINEIKEIIGEYAQYLYLRDDLRFENNKLIRRSKIGDIVEKDKPVRVTENYKIFAYHFECALPYTNYLIADIETGKVYEIPEVHTQWTPGALKEITENLKAGKDLVKEEMEKQKEKFKNEFNPFALL